MKVKRLKLRRHANGNPVINDEGKEVYDVVEEEQEWRQPPYEPQSEYEGR